MSRQPVGEPEAFARAVSSEVRAEMGRQNVSVRTLATAMGRSAPYVQDRINDLKTFNLNDLEQISAALTLLPGQLIDRAHQSLEKSGYVLAAKRGEPEPDDQ